MRKRGFSLIRKTERWMHRRRGTCEILIPSDIQSERVTKFILQGSGETSESGARLIGVGDYDSENGAYKINLHIHGRNYLSGEDFAAIHMSKEICTSAAVKNGQYMFIPDADSPEIPLIDKSIIKFKENTAYTIAFTVKYLTSTKPRDLKLKINYTDGTSYIPSYDSYIKEFTECISTDPTKTIKEIASYIGDKQLTVFITEKFGIYQGIYSTHAEAHEAYNGEKYDISLTAPLYAIDYSRDEIDLIHGEVTRKIKKLLIDASSEIRQTDTDGVYAIALEDHARIGSRIVSPLTSPSESSESGICLSENGEEVIFYAPEEISDLGEMEEYLRENPFEIFYVLKETVTEYIEPFSSSLEGKSVIDIKTEIAPEKCFIEYH